MTRHYLTHVKPALDRVLKLAGGSMDERAQIAAWRALRNSPKYTKRVGGRRQATPAWYKLQADMCEIVQRADQVIAEQEIKDPRHPLVRLRRDMQQNFVLANDGVLRSIVARYGVPGLRASEDRFSAYETVLQEARMGMAHGMSRFDSGLKGAANAVTYTLLWANAFVRKSQMITGRVITMKGREPDFRAVEMAVRDIENEGRAVSVAEVSDRTGLSAQDVLMLLDFTQPMTHLDAPVGGADDEPTSISSFIPDTRVDITGDLMKEDMLKTVSAAARSLHNPYHRAVLEMVYGLNGRPQAQQNALFDGVFVDEDGNQYASKATIARAEHRLGPNGEQIVQLRPQSELSRGLREGRLRFVPGTPEAAELVRIMTAKEGGPWAPTSGSVQEAQVRAEAAIKSSPQMQQQRQQLRYRGDNVIENSDLALEELKLALVSIGAMSEQEAAKLRTGPLSAVRSNSKATGRKGSARLQGEKAGLIDPATGRFTQKAREIIARSKAQAQAARERDIQSEIETDDIAELMSTV